MTTTASDVAAWMLQRIEQSRYLDQEDAATEIERRFGETFVQYNDDGGLSIHPDVRKAFRKISEATVVWSRADRQWRRREAGDPPGRQVD